MKKILVVDDEEWIQTLYTDELTEEGYQVITSGDGSQLMDIIEQNRPDLVVLDIRLGEHNGLDLLQDIRNAYDDLPVLLCTAYPAFAKDPKSAAADDYLVKSSDLSKLKRKIRSAIAGKGSSPEMATPEKADERRTFPLIRDQMKLALGHVEQT